MVPSVWDLTDVELKGDSRLPSWTDARFARVAGQALMDSPTVNRRGARFVWLSFPAIDPDGGGQPRRWALAAKDPTRVAAMDDVIKTLERNLAKDRSVPRAPFATFSLSQPPGQPPILTDGVGVDPRPADRWPDWLGPGRLVRYDPFLAPASAPAADPALGTTPLLTAEGRGYTSSHSMVRTASA